MGIKLNNNQLNELLNNPDINDEVKQQIKAKINLSSFQPVERKYVFIIEYYFPVILTGVLLVILIILLLII